MREIKTRLTQRNTLWSQLEQMYFITELKDPEQNSLQVCEAISLQSMCSKFCINLGFPSF